jgi:hypothetical protein
MKSSIILVASFALVFPVAAPLWADNEVNTSGRTTLSWQKSMEHQPGATAEEIQDFINDEFQRNGCVKSERILKTTPAFRVGTTKAVDGVLTKPHVVFLDARGNILWEKFGDAGELRVDAQDGKLELQVSETNQEVHAGGGFSTTFTRQSFHFELPSLKSTARDGSPASQLSTRGPSQDVPVFKLGNLTPACYSVTNGISLKKLLPKD